MKKQGLLFIFFIASLISFSQRVEWAHAISGDSLPGLPNTGSSPTDLDIDKADNSYFLGSFNNAQLGTTAGTKSSIIKYNKDGRELWHKNFDLTITALTAADDSCKLYALAKVDSNTKIGNDFYINKKSVYGNYSLVLIKADSSFNIEWTRLVSDSIIPSAWYYNYSFDITTIGNSLIVKENCSAIRFKGKVYGDITNWDIAIMLRLEKYKAGSGNEWINVFDESFSPAYWTIIRGLEPDNKGYIFSVISTEAGVILLNGVFYNLKSRSAILKTHISTGNCTFMALDTTYWHEIYSLSVLPSGKLFVAGAFDRTFNYRSISLTAKNPYDMNAMFLLLENNGDPVWALQEENGTGKGRMIIQQTACRNGKIYGRGTIQDGTSGINGILVNNLNGLAQQIAFKLDTLGNCLWAYGIIGGGIYYFSPGPIYLHHSNYFGYYYGTSLSVDSDGSPYFTDKMWNSYHLLDTIVSVPTPSNAIIYKIGDFAIYRGYVCPGPYCAGDTIEIPYTLKGKYDTANVFIAQLSDEFGNFNGGQRELGRLKSNQPGVVKGVLPLFDVETSGEYRIRILSTKPLAQSDYIKDTLKLMVYSRDSANAGPDLTICYGQSVQLKTTGGSRWQWSPAATLDKPNWKRPVATPLASTEYRIIISDSSGCGDTDTDYVYINVRQPLDIKAPFTDTTICRGQVLTLFANATGGDSSRHYITWYERKGTGDVKINAGNSLVNTTCGDSCAAKPKLIFAVLTDSCTTKPDTQFYSIKVLPALDIHVKNNPANAYNLADTTLCFDTKITLYADNSGGRGSPYTVSWLGQVTATGDSLPLNPAQQGTYYAVLTDNCTAKPDTAKITLTIRPPLSISIKAVDSICQKQPVSLMAIATGGDSTQYNIGWKTNNSTWAYTGNPASHIPALNTVYTATLTDNCSPQASSSIAVTVTPVPKPGFVISNSEGCPPLQVLFTDASSGNDPALNVWRMFTTPVYTGQNWSYDFYTTGAYIFSLVATGSNGCKDTVVKKETITVLEKPQAGFYIKPDIREIDNEILLYNNSYFAARYQWSFGDGLYSYGSADQKKIFTDTGYYDISLVAENDKGCMDTAVQRIRIFDHVGCIVPNAFTPGPGDDLNATFRPLCTGLDAYTLSIFNRWGQLIYQTQNGAWNGQYEGRPAIDGAYMYKIDIQGANGKKETLFGVVNVLR